MRSILLALITVVALGAGEFPDISTEELKTHITNKTVTVIDVNGSASYQEAHIPGAINFEMVQKHGDLAARLPAEKDALIVAYCGGPMCGAWKRAATAVAEMGYTNVKHYSEGIKGWKKAHDTAAMHKADNDCATCPMHKAKATATAADCATCPMGTKQAQAKDCATCPSKVKTASACPSCAEKGAKQACATCTSES